MGFSRSLILSVACIAALGGCSSGPADKASDGPEATMGQAVPGDGAEKRDLGPTDAYPSRPGAQQSTDAYPSRSTVEYKTAEAPPKGDIFFDYDMNAIKKEYQDVLISHSRYLVANPERAIVLQGNADERGSREYNMALGNERAQAVKRALVLLGVAESRIEAVSFGEEKPRAAGHEEAAWGVNRRVDFAYSR